MSLPAVSSARLGRAEWRNIAAILPVILVMNVVAWMVLL